MRAQSFQNKNILILLASLLSILLIYSVNLYELSYKLKGWEKMGQSPVAARQIQYLMADTSALVGFKDPESGEQVTCGTSIAYVKTAAGDPYRCCDTGEKIACLAGDFSTEIPVFDEACTSSLKEVFAIPDTLEDTVDYQVFGNCSGAIGVTVAQIDSSGQIQWKAVETRSLDLVTTVLRCIAGPLLLGLAIWTVVRMVRRRRNEPIPKR